MSSGFCNIEQIEPDTEGDWDNHHCEDTGIDPSVVLHRPGEIEDDTDDDEPVSEGLASAVLGGEESSDCPLYTSPSPRDLSTSRMPSSA